MEEFSFEKRTGKAVPCQSRSLSTAEPRETEEALPLQENTSHTPEARRQAKTTRKQERKRIFALECIFCLLTCGVCRFSVFLEKHALPKKHRNRQGKTQRKKRERNKLAKTKGKARRRREPVLFFPFFLPRLARSKRKVEGRYLHFADYVTHTSEKRRKGGAEKTTRKI